MSPANPLVSVVMPVYNAEQHVARAITSVLNQTIDDLELIVVDDGSTDGSAAAVRDAVRSICPDAGDRVRLLTHPVNGGYGKATNTGLDHARGDWVWFIDSDDWAEPTMLEQLLDTAVERSAEMAICGIRGVHLDTGTGRRLQQSLPIEGVSTGIETLRLLARAELVAFQTNKLVARPVWEQVRSPVGNAYGDLIFVAELMRGCHRVAFIDEPLYNYALHSGSVTGRLRPSILDLADVDEQFRPILDRAFSAREARKLKRHFTYRQVYWPLVHGAARSSPANELAIDIQHWVFPRIRWGHLVWFLCHGRWALAATLGLAKGFPQLHGRLLRIYKGEKS